MKRIYIISDQELNEAKERVQKLRENALYCRDCGDTENSQMFYYKAKGAAEILEILGIFKKAGD